MVDARAGIMIGAAAVLPTLAHPLTKRGGNAMRLETLKHLNRYTSNLAVMHAPPQGEPVKLVNARTHR